MRSRRDVPDGGSHTSLCGIRYSLLSVALLATSMLLAAGCGFYSFTGASIPPHLRTIAVPLVEDVSVSVADDLDERMTRLLIDRFVGQTRLQLETSQPDADAVLSGRIERITVEPVAVAGGDIATQNRVSVTVSVRYFDQAEDREVLQRSFTGTANYDASAGGDREVEVAAILRALQNVADDIFTAATSNW
jgi:hypothetical protein